MAKKELVKHNNFIEASMPGFKELEMKIFFAFIMKLQKDKTKMCFNIEEIQELIGSSKDLSRFTEACDGLQKKLIKFKDGDIIKSRSVFPAVDTNLKTKTVELQMHEDLMPYFFDIKERYTILSCDEIAKLQSKYAIRLYELLMQYKSLKKRYCTIDFLRDKLDIPDTYKYSHIKQRVIEPSLLELTNETNLKVSFEEIKEKSKTKPIVVAIEFTITEKDAPAISDELKIAVSAAKKNVNFAIKYDSSKKSESIISDIAKKYGKEKTIKALYSIADVRKNTGEIKYLKAYISTIIENTEESPPGLPKPTVKAPSNEVDEPTAKETSYKTLTEYAALLGKAADELTPIQIQVYNNTKKITAGR